MSTYIVMTLKSPQTKLKILKAVRQKGKDALKGRRVTLMADFSTATAEAEDSEIISSKG